MELFQKLFLVSPNVLLVNSNNGNPNEHLLSRATKVMENVLITHAFLPVM